MDKKHREYCIKLGNPYYTVKNEEANETNLSQDNFEIDVEDNNSDNWLKNTKKFTN